MHASTQSLTKCIVNVFLVSLFTFRDRLRNCYEAMKSEATRDQIVDMKFNKNIVKLLVSIVPVRRKIIFKATRNQKKLI